MESWLVVSYGLTDEQNEVIKRNLPSQKCEMVALDCFTDILALNEMAVIVNADTLNHSEQEMLVEYYSEITPFSETLVPVGEMRIPEEWKRYVVQYENFDDLAEQIKYVLLGAYRKTKKTESFSSSLANAIMILTQIRLSPYITTKELASKLELSERTIKRYIETLRVAGEWIEYDTRHKGWALVEGKSVLWGDY